jgi:hypothetical protein
MSTLMDLMDGWLSRHRPVIGMDPEEFILFREAQIIMGIETPLQESEPAIQLTVPCFELDTEAVITYTDEIMSVPEVVKEPVLQPKEEARYSFKQILMERQAQKTESIEIAETREPLKIDWKYARKNPYLINR